jgi:hypothetical protein
MLKTMKIEVLYFEDCPNHLPTLERIRHVLRGEGCDAEIGEVLVQDADAAHKLRFLGSPTVRVSGIDIEPAAKERKDFGLMCRRYANGVPSDELIRNAVRSASGCPAQITLKPSSKSTVIASITALGSVIVASSCCLPFLPFLFAAGAAGTSAFVVQLRPYLLVLSVFLIAFGFYKSWRAKKCNCKPSLVSTFLLWFSAIVVVAFIFFPQVIANLVADLLAGKS